MVFYWSLIDSRSSQVFRTLLRIVADYYYFLRCFHTSVNWWSFTGVWVTASIFKSTGLLSVSRTPLSTLVDQGNAVIWMMPARLPISRSSNHLSKPLESVLIAPVLIGITVTFMLHNFFSSLARSKYLYLFSFSLIFYSVVHRDGYYYLYL